MTANALASNIKLYTKHTLAVIEAKYHNKRPDKYAEMSN